MSISTRTRKLLWGRSGNRCAICRCELVRDATNQDSEIVVGDECHIVAKEANGPRGDPKYPRDKLDLYTNLILLCKTHHKMVDDQPAKYSIKVLEKIKTDHENWVRSRLDTSTANATMQRPKLVTLKRIRIGNDLTKLVLNSHLLQCDYDPPKDIAESMVLEEFVRGIEELPRTA